MGFQSEYAIAILAAAAAIATFMEAVVKPGLKDGLPALFKRLPYVRDFPGNVKWTFRMISILASIIAVATLFPDASFFKWLGYYSVGDVPHYVDIFTTGVIVGLGEKKAHDVMDFVIKNKAWLKKAGDNVPVHS